MTRYARTLQAVRPRLPATPTRVAVLAGDLLALSVLFAVGLVHHGVMPLELPRHTAETIAPFAIAWILLAPIVGLYLPTTLTSYGRTIGLVIGGWTVIALLGGLLRSTNLFHGNAPATFLLVNIALGLLLLLPWRLAVTAWLRRRQTGRTRDADA